MNIEQLKFGEQPCMAQSRYCSLSTFFHSSHHEHLAH